MICSVHRMMTRRTVKVNDFFFVHSKNTEIECQYKFIKTNMNISNGLTLFFFCFSFAYLKNKWLSRMIQSSFGLDSNKGITNEKSWKIACFDLRFCFFLFLIFRLKPLDIVLSVFIYSIKEAYRVQSTKSVWHSDIDNHVVRNKNTNHKPLVAKTIVGKLLVKSKDTFLISIAANQNWSKNKDNRNSPKRNWKIKTGNSNQANKERKKKTKTKTARVLIQ